MEHRLIIIHMPLKYTPFKTYVYIDLVHLVELSTKNGMYSKYYSGCNYIFLYYLLQSQQCVRQLLLIISCL